ncbi:THUMP domain containing 2 L homeolog [Xenopus laevis]|uniref:THUMP domain containing 2 L homeolog n=1 Tax=Xenopus laevis TaxID=8355 RepID=Q6DDJ1_XENLA|nr:THUMP domain containing 2 L homeolog [Xenopus laevis]AAH77569.1 Thumpd2-prov protein [Xenopus laevis]
MEHFVTQEVMKKLSATEVETMSGKVLFTAEPDLCRLRLIKSGERLFLLLKNDSPLSLPKNKGKARSALREYVIGEPQIWLHCLAVWQKLQEQLQQHQHVCGMVGISSKRKSGSASEFHISKYSKQDNTARDRVCLFDDQTHKNNMSETEDQNTMDSKELDATEQQLLSKTHKNTTPITFRVSCRCSGASAKVFTAQEVGAVIGASIIKQFGWKPDLRTPSLEVFVHLNDQYSVVGFPVTRQPLASRDYIRNTGLRSTTAWAMGALAELHVGALVLDPMCGVGTILLEAAKEWPFGHFVGVDNNDSQLKSAVSNVKGAGLGGSIELLKGSVLDLPFVSESIDAVISDIPFGRKFTSSRNMKDLLPDIIREMQRVVRVEGIIVLLLSQCLHHHLKVNFHFGAIEKKNISSSDNHTVFEVAKGVNKDNIVNKTHWFDSLVALESHSVSLGVTEAVIFKCKKTLSSLPCNKFV